MTAGELEEQRHLQLVLAVRAVAQTPAGRRVLWWIVDELAGALGASYSGENATHTAYLEGQRKVGCEVVALCMESAPQEFVHMLGEALERRRNAAESKEPGDGG